MPRPDSKIMQTNMDTPATDAAVKPSRLRATPISRKSNVVPLDPPSSPAANEPVAEAPKKRGRKPKEVVPLTPAQAKQRRKDLVESLKIAGQPLKEANLALQAANTALARAMAEHEKTVGKLVKDHEKNVKALTKARDAADAVAKKRATAFEQGKAKIEGELAKLG